MNRIRLGFVAVAVAVGMGLVGAAGATPKDDYNKCSQNAPEGADPESTNMVCCINAGGTPYTERYPDGLEIFRCDFGEAQQVEPTPRPRDPRIGSTSGTYEQPQSTPAPSRTGGTSGTYSP